MISQGMYLRCTSLYGCWGILSGNWYICSKTKEKERGGYVICGHLAINLKTVEYRESGNLLVVKPGAISWK